MLSFNLVNIVLYNGFIDGKSILVQVMYGMMPSVIAWTNSDQVSIQMTYKASITVMSHEC